MHEVNAGLGKVREIARGGERVRGEREPRERERRERGGGRESRFCIQL